MNKIENNKIHQSHQSPFVDSFGSEDPIHQSSTKETRLEGNIFESQDGVPTPVTVKARLEESSPNFRRHELKSLVFLCLRLKIRRRSL